MDIREEIIELLGTSLLVDDDLKRKIVYGLWEDILDDEELLQICLFLRSEDGRLREYLDYTLQNSSVDNLCNVKGKLTMNKIKNIRKQELLESDNERLDLNELDYLIA